MARSLALFAAPRHMPPLSTNDGTATDYKQHNKSTYGAKKNHPTTFDDNPLFKGPLKLEQTLSPDMHRNRIQHYYLEDDTLSSSLSNHEKIPKITPSSSTATILKSIVDHLAYVDAPVDAKEVAESIEFYLRAGKRLIGAAKRVLQLSDSGSHRTIIIKDLCCGHGLSAMLFLACISPCRIPKNTSLIAELVDQSEPKSHSILRDCINEVCPWVSADTVSFVSSPLDEYTKHTCSGENNDETTIVISTHACGKLTDKVLKHATDISAASLAVMPCCYTGTDAGVPYGVRRMLGVSAAADVQRSFYLQEHDYHVDFAAIPQAITPMNRIIVAERRK